LVKRKGGHGKKRGVTCLCGEGKGLGPLAERARLILTEKKNFPLLASKKKRGGERGGGAESRGISVERGLIGACSKVHKGANNSNSIPEKTFPMQKVSQWEKRKEPLEDAPSTEGDAKVMSNLVQRAASSSSVLKKRKNGRDSKLAPCLRKKPGKGCVGERPGNHWML